MQSKCVFSTQLCANDVGKLLSHVMYGEQGLTNQASKCVLMNIMKIKLNKLIARKDSFMHEAI